MKFKKKKLPVANFFRINNLKEMKKKLKLLIKMILLSNLLFQGEVEI